ncbi:basic leucine zipper 43-like [Durio zibethinus]|uniref:Basic leucine zipper 43-like n=1 Tax=Durio zibethinus TaxID=66656 RepID=A0A6P5YA97_DURZI|nr:basic leucine zipper 43-like [Durio zibethinus]
MEEPDFEVHRNQPNGSQIQNFFAFCPSQKTFTSATQLNMQSWEIAGNRSLPQGNSSLHPDSSTNFSNRLFPNSQIHFPFHLFSPNGSSLSTENEAREYQPSIVDDKRLRRMISNRESARRSRMRKKQQIEELQSQVDQLQTINRQLSQKLINLLESNHDFLQENAQLKEKVSTLHMVLADVFTPLRNQEDTFLEHKSDS